MSPVVVHVKHPPQPTPCRIRPGAAAPTAHEASGSPIGCVPPGRKPRQGGPSAAHLYPLGGFALAVGAQIAARPRSCRWSARARAGATRGRCGRRPPRRRRASGAFEAYIAFELSLCSLPPSDKSPRRLARGGRWRFGVQDLVCPEFGTAELAVTCCRAPSPADSLVRRRRRHRAAADEGMTNCVAIRGRVALRGTAATQRIAALMAGRSAASLPRSPTAVASALPEKTAVVPARRRLLRRPSAKAGPQADRDRRDCAQAPKARRPTLRGCARRCRCAARRRRRRGRTAPAAASAATAAPSSSAPRPPRRRPAA